MSIPIRYSRDRVKDLEDIILDLQEQRIRQAGHIAQLVAMRRLQVRCKAAHSPLVRQECATAEDAADDLIDRMWPVQPPADEWPRLPSSMLTNGGDA